jgi:hypothetical protein
MAPSKEPMFSQLLYMIISELDSVTAPVSVYNAYDIYWNRPIPLRILSRTSRSVNKASNKEKKKLLSSFF